MRREVRAGRAEQKSIIQVQQIAGSMRIGPMIAAALLRPDLFGREHPHEGLVRATERSTEAGVTVEVHGEDACVDARGPTIPASDRQRQLTLPLCQKPDTLTVASFGSRPTASDCPMARPLESGSHVTTPSESKRPRVMPPSLATNTI
jgi:hypothetical protein